MDEEPAPPPREVLVEADLSRLSVDEIESRIARLRAEITRLEAALAQKQASRAAADAAFRL
ncbi:DUF1192 domain-containing protein [Xanthobacter dioxanivorans]|uniref:DUF1192 domain-containing protein n=1 Tax=Xanthobacter dioxanivorans TaxID=2528964 RepID=A0A974PJU7_9HYPH|nr:DUF1192 domain-containing protein [Xanthobacter dioxanivorans]QRG04531.1 DUF1192 domain-containing protein [Xanthobacter dioxanivorans]